MKNRYLNTWVEYEGQPYYVITPFRIGGGYDLFPGDTTISMKVLRNVSSERVHTLKKLYPPTFSNGETVLYKACTTKYGYKTELVQIVDDHRQYRPPYPYVIELKSGERDTASPFELSHIDL